MKHTEPFVSKNQQNGRSIVKIPQNFYLILFKWYHFEWEFNVSSTTGGVVSRSGSCGSVRGFPC